MRVVVDEDLCVGHGRCYATAPVVFEPDERGHSVVVADPVPAHLADVARAAVANCPERAISIED